MFTAIEKGDFQILIATPEAVMMPGSIRLLTSAPLKEQLCLLCFDEAHCISEWQVKVKISNGQELVHQI